MYLKRRAWRIINFYLLVIITKIMCTNHSNDSPIEKIQDKPPTNFQFEYKIVHHMFSMHRTRIHFGPNGLVAFRQVARTNIAYSWHGKIIIILVRWNKKKKIRGCKTPFGHWKSPQVVILIHTPPLNSFYCIVICCINWPRSYQSILIVTNDLEWFFKFQPNPFYVE